MKLTVAEASEVSLSLPPQFCFEYLLSTTEIDIINTLFNHLRLPLV